MYDAIDTEKLKKEFPVEYVVPFSYKRECVSIRRSINQ